MLCQICNAEFVPRPNVPHQSCCSPPCSRENQRRQGKAWREARSPGPVVARSLGYILDACHVLTATKAGVVEAKSEKRWKGRLYAGDFVRVRFHRGGLVTMAFAGSFAEGQETQTARALLAEAEHITL